jgi:hypothetical protein
MLKLKKTDTTHASNAGLDPRRWHQQLVAQRDDLPVPLSLFDTPPRDGGDFSYLPRPSLLKPCGRTTQALSKLPK